MEEWWSFIQSNEQKLHATQSTPLQIREEIEEGVKRSIPYMVEAMKSALESGEVQCQCNQQLMAMVKEAVNKEIPQAIEAGLSKHVQQLGDLIRSTVEEVLLQKMSNNPISRSLPNDAESPVIMKTLQLHFVGILPDSFFTLNNVTTEGSTPLLVELVDMSESRVEIGPESSAKIKIVVLDGDFDAQSTEKSFNESEVKPRKDKGSLLKGKCDISLMAGVATVDNLAFTDNSKSMRNGSFRLGAQVVEVFPGVVIKEAVSEAFKVKERRLQSNGKAKKPSLDDDVSCLKYIGSTISKRLADKKINKVRDFLQLYHTDEKALQKIFGVNNNKWPEIIANAKSCLLTKEEYHYHDDIKGVDIVLDCVFNIVSVTFQGQSCQPFEILHDSDKKLIYEIRCKAYEKRSELQPAIIPTRQTSMQVESLHAWNPYINMYPAGSTSETGQPEMLQNTNYCAPAPDFTSLPTLTEQLTFGTQSDDQNTDFFDQFLFNNYDFNIGSTNNAQSAVVIPESIEQDELWARCGKDRWLKVRSVVKMIVIEFSLKQRHKTDKRELSLKQGHRAAKKQKFC